jgi:hypothetical protein
MYSIRETLIKKPYLTEVKTNVYKIPERLKDYDDSIYILWNKLRKKYELHSTDNKWGGTYCFDIPFNELDDRTIKLVIMGDMAIRPKEWAIEVEEKLEKSDKEEQKEVAEKKGEAIERMQFALKKLARELCL